MAKKVTPELAKIRGIPSGIDLRPSVTASGYSRRGRSCHQSRGASGGDRLSGAGECEARSGRIRDDIKIASKDGFDFVELDGMQGSTGAGSAEVIDNVRASQRFPPLLKRLRRSKRLELETRSSWF